MDGLDIYEIQCTGNTHLIELYDVLIEQFGIKPLSTDWDTLFKEKTHKVYLNNPIIKEEYKDVIKEILNKDKVEIKVRGIKDTTLSLHLNYIITSVVSDWVIKFVKDTNVHYNYSQYKRVCSTIADYLVDEYGYRNLLTKEFTGELISMFSK